MEASVDSYDYDSGDMHRRASELNDGKIRKRVLVLTEGVMVRICRLLEAAAIQAIETEHEHINLQTLTDDLTTGTLVSISDRRSRRTAN